jgi:hypothetical protein
MQQNHISSSNFLNKHSLLLCTFPNIHLTFVTFEFLALDSPTLDTYGEQVLSIVISQFNFFVNFEYWFEKGSQSKS